MINTWLSLRKKTVCTCFKRRHHNDGIVYWLKLGLWLLHYKKTLDSYARNEKPYKQEVNIMLIKFEYGLPASIQYW